MSPQYLDVDLSKNLDKIYRLRYFLFDLLNLFVHQVKDISDFGSMALSDRIYEPFIDIVGEGYEIQELNFTFEALPGYEGIRFSEVDEELMDDMLRRISILLEKFKLLDVPKYWIHFKTRSSNNCCLYDIFLIKTVKF